MGGAILRGGARGGLAALLAALAAAPSPALSGADADRRSELLRFAAEMAGNGDWREARYRWEKILAADPDDPRVLNNLAVANEVLGEPERAAALYEKALALSGDDERIRENANRAASFSPRAASAGTGPGREGVGDEPPARSDPRRGRKGVVSLPVKLPLAARLPVAEDASLLVASFLGRESDLFDTGREIVRFLRAEFHKKTALRVRDVTPPPAVPEQPLEDFVANAEFWKHLGTTHDADLVVSGVVEFSRRDASGFGEVDMVSPVTGQKVRRTQFVEREEFVFDVDVMFFDGRTGALLFRDRLRRTVLFRGSSNDPLTAFYRLAESFGADVLAVVSPRTREDTRFVFRR